MHSELRRDEAMAVLRDGGVGFVRRDALTSFYANFEVIPHPDDVLVEVTFNPEWVDLGGLGETDVVVFWGATDEVARCLAEFLGEFDVELCLADARDQVAAKLFGAEPRQVTSVDLVSPWASMD